MSTTSVALTVHLVIAEDHPEHRAAANGFLNETAEGLRTRFGIGHATLQIEAAGGPACRLARECAA